ncbi:sugar phosphate nucleotidyltransferase [Pirellulales bacterium]|nr:sugar phosphate nucleotidyltransferase [Pirellulales bacterium]
MLSKVVLLAAGRGSRMRRSEPNGSVSAAQAAVAESGIKALIPIDAPFLDYGLTAVADAGYRRVCLVVGPGHSALRDRYARMSGGRLEFEFAVQQSPLGTADALAAAEGFAGSDPFLLINSDNYYPVEPLRQLRELEGPGTVGFQRAGLLAASNIPAERISRFALMEQDDCGTLRKILEKPEHEVVENPSEPLLVSMNCWRFGPEIFAACRAIGKSSRGENELPDAVEYSMRELGQRYQVVSSSAGVLDLSCQADIAPVADRLAGMKVEL